MSSPGSLAAIAVESRTGYIRGFGELRSAGLNVRSAKRDHREGDSCQDESILEHLEHMKRDAVSVTAVAKTVLSIVFSVRYLRIGLGRDGI